MYVVKTVYFNYNHTLQFYLFVLILSVTTFIHPMGVSKHMYNILRCTSSRTMSPHYSNRRHFIASGRLDRVQYYSNDY